MQEDFLHYIWQHKKFDLTNLKTTDNKSISIVTVGAYNKNSGPDFFNAHLKIDEQLWAGMVEIHVKSSDWYVHNHEQDKNYDNVILHVVWEHDTEVFRRDNSLIPTLEIRHYVSRTALNNYEKLFSKSQKWINCENDFYQVDDFILKNWLERLYLERLERKTESINQLLADSKNNWEAVLFKMMAKNFGLKVNGEAFYSMAHTIDFSIIRKLQSNQTALEALLFGQAGLLEDDIEDAYYLNLIKEFQFLKHKFKLSNQNTLPVQFFRLRPPNFPTIRISQLANLYYQSQNLFSQVIECQNLNEFYDIFSVAASPYWESHYTFGKGSKSAKRPLTKSFINLLLMNTIIPIKFSYANQTGQTVNDEIISLVTQIPSETNSIVEKFESLKPVTSSALQSQGLIQLKNEYCTKNRCLHCAIGSAILTGNH